MDKVLILSNNASGLYSFRFELIEELINQGFDVYFSVPQSKDQLYTKKISDSGAKPIQTNMNRRGMNPLEDLSLFKRYKKMIKEVDPKVVLTYSVKPNIYGSLAASKYDKPVLMNITGMGTSLYYSKLKAIIIMLYKIACSKANTVFFQNESNREFFVSNRMVKTEKTIIISGSGVNTEKFKPMSSSNREDKIKFVFIGRLMKEKGIEEYLEAARAVLHTNTKVEFQIVGSYEEKCYEEILRNNQWEGIKYLGFSTDIRNEIKEVDCIVNPSYHEGMSNVLLEGASMGKPLIASNIPGCKEIIDDGQNGYLFDVKSVSSLQDKITRFIELSDEERTLMGEKSRQKVIRDFERQKIVNQYVEAIRMLIERRAEGE